MPRLENEHLEPPAHVRNIDKLQHQVASKFNAMMDALLKDEPNTITEGPVYRGELPTDKAMKFEFRRSTVIASCHVGFRSPPTYRLEIRTPIAVDNPQDDPMLSAYSQYPQAPHEIVKFKSSLEDSPYFGSISLTVEAVNRLGDFGHEITVDQYTAGGLLPPINILGNGKIGAFKSVIELFDGFVPQNPVYTQPFNPLKARAARTR